MAMGRPIPPVRDVEDSYRAALIIARDARVLDMRGQEWRRFAGRVLCEYGCHVLAAPECPDCARTFERAVVLLGGALMALQMLAIAYGSRAAVSWADPCVAVAYAAGIYRRRTGRV